jgi:threonyl-tRNA synthetase
MEDYWRAEHIKRGYSFVNSPHVGNANLWQTSGHLGFYRDGMYPAMTFPDDEGEYFCKPMNCPFHLSIYGARPRSYRDLPLRFAELGTVYRWERSGTLHGLMRVRGFTQDDTHIFCTPEQVEGEIENVVRFALDLLRTFGFTEFTSYIATKPKDSVGPAEMWDKATESLKRAADKVGLQYAIDEGGGAFYGPKIDVRIKDAIGREWQCSTVQFDFNMSERFKLEYTGADNKPHRPYMVHRALYGSLERFFGVLIEHHEGRFPLWIAPTQVRILPITDRGEAFAKGVADELFAAGIRVEIAAKEPLKAMDARRRRQGRRRGRRLAARVPWREQVDAAQGHEAFRVRGDDSGARRPADEAVFRSRSRSTRSKGSTLTILRTTRATPAWRQFWHFRSVDRPTVVDPVASAISKSITGSVRSRCASSTPMAGSLA